MNVVYEQPAKFNRYVDDSIPLTWQRRWQGLKPAMPWVAFWYVTIAEVFSMRRWLAEGVSPDGTDVVFALLAPFPLIALGLLVAEAGLRLQHCSRRILKLREKWVLLKPAKASQVSWKWIRAWRFEPIQDHPELTKLTVLIGPAKPGRWRRCWSMVLASPEQRPDLLAQLRSQQDSADHICEVRVLNQPKSSPKVGRPRRGRALGFAIYLLGVYLLVHGGPLFAFGVVCPKDPGPIIRGREQPVSHPRELLRAWVTTNFSSPAELRRFALIMGGTLTACSVASLVGGSVLMNRSLKRTWAAREAEVLSPT